MLDVDLERPSHLIIWNRPIVAMAPLEKCVREWLELSPVMRAQAHIQITGEPVKLASGREVTKLAPPVIRKLLPAIE